VKVFFDTNVVLDYVLMRKPYYADAKVLYDEVAAKRVVGLISATSLTNISHLLEVYLHEEFQISKLNSKLGALHQVRKLLPVFKVSAVGSSICNIAAVSAFEDYEDAVQYFCAAQDTATHIVTRNTADYASVKSKAITICDPAQLRAILGV
jgi:predicted nucleic acid-binding protein